MSGGHHKLPGRCCGGFSFIEVMVAAAILAVGVVGVAGMQIQSLKANHGAHMASQAAALGSNMMARARANPKGYRGDEYHHAAAAAEAGEYHGACADSTGCSPEQMAEHDLAVWAADLAARLPRAEGVVCIDSTPNDGARPSADGPSCDGAGDRHVVKLWWDAGLPDPTGDDPDFVMEFDTY